MFLIFEFTEPYKLHNLGIKNIQKPNTNYLFLLKPKTGPVEEFLKYLVLSYIFLMNYLAALKRAQAVLMADGKVLVHPISSRVKIRFQYQIA